MVGINIEGTSFVVLGEPRASLSINKRSVRWFVHSVDESDASSLGTAPTFNIMHHEQYSIWSAEL